MSEDCNGILAVWNDVDPAHEDEFNEWYQREHLLDRLGVAGFLDARRYVAVHGAPKYAAFYTTKNLGVLSSPAYRERLEHPTDWTRRVMPWFRNMSRSVCRIAASSGAGVGGVVGCVWLSGDAQVASSKRIAEVIFPGLVADAAIVKAQLWIADRGVSQVSTVEAALRVGADQVAERVVVIDGTDEDAVARACGSVTEELEPRAHATGGSPALYRLLSRLP